ncbi:CPBP family intramembrane metalloprotease [Candidatus Bathyarchaeota archaeon]|nr:CPBP family intramembrane metalloprotease [Candidatus Bathyarchaeota archaeon]
MVNKGFSGVLLSVSAFIITFALIAFLDGAILVFYSEALSINIYDSSTFLPVIIIVNESVFGFASIIFGALIFKDNLKKELGLFSINLSADFKIGLLYGFIGWFLAIITAALINYFYPIEAPKELIEVLTPKSLWSLITFIALSWIFIGPCEELFFRGLIQTAFAKWKGVFISVLASAFIFSLAHLDFRFWVRSISTFILGLLYGWVYYRRKSIISVAVAHSLNDSLAFILAFIVK